MLTCRNKFGLPVAWLLQQIWSIYLQACTDAHNFLFSLHLQKPSVQTFSKCHHSCRQGILSCKKSFGRVRFVSPPRNLSESFPLLQILLLISIPHISVASVLCSNRTANRTGVLTPQRWASESRILCNGCRHTLGSPHTCECGRSNKDVVL
jgi:hypothetical protein